jgi:thioredoxin 1
MNKIIIKKFGAEWCGPCRLLAPILEEINSENENIEYIAIDTDSNQQAAIDANVKAIPHVVIIIDGVEKESFVGIKNKEEIMEIIQKHY